MQCIILDRDGVINFDSDNYIKSPAEWLAIPGSLEAIKRLNDAGILTAVATNQAGPAKGKFSKEQMALTFEKMHTELAQIGAHIDYTTLCAHHPDDNCPCRKPKPGMLLEIAEQLKIDLTDSYFIGDSYKDIEAARAVSATPILVKTGKGERTLSAHPELTSSIAIYDNLAAAIDGLLS